MAGGRDGPWNERRLADFHNRRAASGADQPPPGSRAEQCERFIALLKSEGRHSVLEVGAGAGLDGLKFVRAGIHYTGVDPSEGQVQRARSRGLDVSVASAGGLPFPAESFPAVWSMSALLHVPASDIHTVLGELVRVTAPGSPIAVSLWSGDYEQVPDPEDDAGPRYFSQRSEAGVTEVFGRHGTVEDLAMWPRDSGAGRGPGAGNRRQQYQFLVLRTPSRGAPN